MDAIEWRGSDDGGTWTAFGPKDGDGGSWRLGGAVRYRRSFSDDPPYWRAYLILDPIGSFPTADEAKTAVEAAVAGAEREAAGSAEGE